MLSLYKDSLNFFEQGNVELAKSIFSTLNARSNQIHFSSKNRNTIYIVAFKQYVPATGSFFFNDDFFSSLANVLRPVTNLESSIVKWEISAKTSK